MPSKESKQPSGGWEQLTPRYLARCVVDCLEFPMEGAGFQLSQRDDERAEVTFSRGPQFIQFSCIAEAVPKELIVVFGRAPRSGERAWDARAPAWILWETTDWPCFRDHRLFHDEDDLRSILMRFREQELPERVLPCMNDEVAMEAAFAKLRKHAEELAVEDRRK